MTRRRVDPDIVEAQYRRMALETIERSHGAPDTDWGKAARQAAIDMVDVLARFARVTCQWQNADMHPYLAGFSVGMAVEMMLRQLRENLRPHALAELDFGIHTGMNVGDDDPAAATSRSIVQPEPLQ